ncbi:gliding motility lipoprotein GldH [Daejeonella sp.]|jgi:gliding motility-associated lipoprotein GldH|uniref:gliding motility lipoprotein GldH n=1 Tax=Daejeonella sp. TaxID=2805397 RepID=UPI0037C0403A
MKYLKSSFLILFSIILFSCQDTQTVVDTNIELNKRNWSYAQKVKIPVKIDSANIPYNLYFNLRHTADYKYSNIFILIHLTSPNGKKITERKEFQLALADGEWLGSGSGNKYSYQIKFKENYKFPKAGTYIFELEQNMRDNPLNHVSDAGIRVEKAQ